MIGLTSLNLFFITYYIPKARKFSLTLGPRITQVKFEFSKPKIILSPLPEAGLLMSAQLSEDPEHFTHQHFKPAFKTTELLKKETEDEN
jgi:hypothetical protein